MRHTACNVADADMVDHELNELKREFLVEARGKVNEMQAALERPSPESFDRLAYLAHQLKGSGGSYGYQRISLDAAELEKAVEKMSAGANGDGDAAANTTVRQHVINLRSEIDRCVRELAS